MGDINLTHAGADIETALGKAVNPDTSPQQGSDKFVTSDGIYNAINNLDASNLDSSFLVTTFTGNISDTKIPTTSAVNAYVSGVTLGPSDIPTNNATTLSIAHGLSATPNYIKAYLVPRSNVDGFTAGSLIDIATDSQDGFILYADATNAYFRCIRSNGTLEIIDPAIGTTGRITVGNANYQIKIVVRSF